MLLKVSFQQLNEIKAQWRDNVCLFKYFIFEITE